MSTLGGPLTSQGIPTWLSAGRRRGILSRLPDDVVIDLVKRSPRIEYPPGTICFRWDDEPKAVTLLSGSARSFLLAPNGIEITTRYLGIGDMTGIFAELTPRMARGLQIFEPTDLLITAAGHMRELTVLYPAFAWELIQELTTVLNASHRALWIRSVATVRQRVAIALLDRSAISGDRITPSDLVRGTQQELATSTGTAREVTNLVLRSLQKEGIIEVRRGHVIITDSERLVREVNEGLGLE